MDAKTNSVKYCMYNFRHVCKNFNIKGGKNQFGWWAAKETTATPAGLYRWVTAVKNNQCVHVYVYR